MLRRAVMKSVSSSAYGAYCPERLEHVETSQPASLPLPANIASSLTYSGVGWSSSCLISANSLSGISALRNQRELEDWEFCVGSILKTTHAEFMKSLPFDIYSRPMFSYYWSAVMNNLGAYLSTHCGISSITNPPSGTFDIVFFDEVRPACDLPVVGFSLRLQFPDAMGISPVDFTEGLVKAIYQRHTPKVHSSETGAIVRIEKPLIYFANWTQRAHQGAGDAISGVRQRRVLRINMFLCPSSEFEDPRAQAHAFSGTPARWVLGERPNPEWLVQPAREVERDQDGAIKTC